MKLKLMVVLRANISFVAEFTPHLFIFNVFCVYIEKQERQVLICRIYK